MSSVEVMKLLTVLRWSFESDNLDSIRGITIRILKVNNIIGEKDDCHYPQRVDNVEANGFVFVTGGNTERAKVCDRDRTE